MRVIFVCGPAYSGKSIYIRKEFANATVVNISKFRENVYSAETNEEIEQMGLNANKYCAEELKDRIKEAGEMEAILLEHTLLHKSARAFFLKEVRKVTDCPVEIIIVDTDKENVEKVTNHQLPLITLHEFERSELEWPSTEEGFVTVSIVRPQFTEEECKR